MVKIITILPIATASMYWYVLIFEKAATTFTTTDGVNGKQSSKKSGPNPCRSTQSINFRTFGCFEKKEKILFWPNFLMSKKSNNAPKQEPTQENKNPSQSPKALAFAITNITNGRNGKNASIIGSTIPGNGPKDRYS